MMLEEMMELMQNADLVVICCEGKEIYRGYVANAKHHIDEVKYKKVISYGVNTEVYKRQEGRGRFNAVFYKDPEILAKMEAGEDLNPEILDMDFTDLSFRIYTKIIIKK